MKRPPQNRFIISRWGISLWVVLLCSILALLTFHPITAQERNATNPGQTRNLEAAAAKIAHGDINLEHSRVFIKVGKVGLGHEHAVVGRIKEGTMHLDKGAGSKIVFDMKSFDADSEFARKYIGLEGTTDEGTRKQVNANMLGKEVLDVNKYPEATFEVRELTPLGSKSSRNLPEYKLVGDFTLHGTKRPVEIQVDVQEEKGWYHMRGGFEILQSQFGIKPFKKMMGAVGVADSLTIFGDLWIAP